MQTNSALTKIKKSNKQEGGKQVSSKQEKSNKVKREKSLFKTWSV